MAMDAKLKAAWVKGLRSGLYKPGTHRLREGDRYDVFGVLCDVSGLGSWEKGTLGQAYELPGAGGLWTHVPPPMLTGTRFSDDVRLIRLADMNDTQKVPFDKMADWIEENL